MEAVCGGGGKCPLILHVWTCQEWGQLAKGRGEKVCGEEVRQAKGVYKVKSSKSFGLCPFFENYASKNDREETS